MPVTNDAEGYVQIKNPQFFFFIYYYYYFIVIFFFALGIKKKVESGFSFKQTLKKRFNYTRSNF